MGVYWYLCRPDTKTMFEAGKSAWTLLHDGEGEASVPRTVEGWLERVKRYWTEGDGQDDVAYQQLMAEALHKFCVGGERFWVISDAGDGVFELTVAQGFELVGSIYYLGDPEKYAEEVKRWNETHQRYRNDAREVDYYRKSWAAMQALGEPKEVKLERVSS